MASPSRHQSARSVLFAAVCVCLATAGHSAATQQAIAPLAVGCGFIGVLVIARLLSGGERSMVTILGGLLGAQFALHSLFSATARHAENCCPPGTGLHLGHHHHAQTLAGAWTGHDGVAMTGAHLAAAIVAAWWLRRGERAVWGLALRVAALAAGRLRALLALLAPARPVHRRTVTRRSRYAPIRPADSALRHSVIGRAPPFDSTAPVSLLVSLAG